MIINMGDFIELTIVTPDKNFYSGEIKELVTANSEGKLGILPGHIAMVTSLAPCITTFTDKDGKKLSAFSANGLLKMRDNKLSLMCEACEWPQDIDIKRAEEAKERADKRIKSKNNNIDMQRAEISLMRAIYRIKATNLKSK